MEDLTIIPKPEEIIYHDSDRMLSAILQLTMEERDLLCRRELLAMCTNGISCLAFLYTCLYWLKLMLLCRMHSGVYIAM